MSKCIECTKLEECNPNRTGATLVCNCPNFELAEPERTFVGHPNGELEVKDTNPKDALGIKKAPLSTLPTGPMYEVALAMLEGARKYGRHNYRVMGVKASVYYDAAMGHLTAWWEGEDTDPASGLHHLAKAMACLAVVRDSEMMGNWVDDRPPHYPDASKLMRNHPAVGEILKRYPECEEPFTWHGGYTVKLDRTEPIERGPHGYCLDCEKKIAEAKHGDLVSVCGKCRPYSHFAVNKEADRTAPVEGGY